MKLQTVAEGSNLITKLQLWTSKPSSRIDVETITFTCKCDSLILKCVIWKIIYFMIYIIVNFSESKHHTVPFRNSSTSAFCILLLWDCNLAVFPAIYPASQPLKLGSNLLSSFCRTIAVMTLSTKTMHLKFFKCLLWNKEDVHNQEIISSRKKEGRSWTLF